MRHPGRSGRHSARLSWCRRYSEHVWEESWALPAVQWVLTPALITGALFALARAYDPPTRWARRLKSDITITAGLPEGPERRVWQEWVNWQATRLREYRLAFTGWTQFFKWAGLAFICVTVIGSILYPPINKPGEPEVWGPGDYPFLLLGLFATTVYTFALGSGHDFFGRSPREIIIRRRVKDFDRRSRRLRRIERVRARRVALGADIRPVGSRLGFSTQVDDLGAWASDFDLRRLAKLGGLFAADIAARVRDKLSERGVEVPKWPELEPSRTPGVGLRAERDPRFRRFPRHRSTLTNGK